MPPLYENARNDFVVADKYRDEAAGGLRDVLQADAQLLSGQIGIGEAINREITGMARVVNGSIGSVFHSNFSSAEGNSDDDFLPKLEFAEKEKAIYLEKQKYISDEGEGEDEGEHEGEGEGEDELEDEGMTRQIKKEKMNYLDSQT